PIGALGACGRGAFLGGFGRFHPARCGGGAGVPRCRGHGCAAGTAAHRAGGARSRDAARICAAHHAAHVRRACRLAGVHFRGRHARSQEPQGGAGHRARARHSPVGAGAGVPHLHRHAVPGPVSRQPAGRR
ncbi:hypothetical protein QU38_00420, partial [Staphylococcus aureus]